LRLARTPSFVQERGPKTSIYTGKPEELNMTIKPLGNRILVKPDTDAAETVGGIYLPDSAKEKPQQGKVVAIGPDVENVKKGDTVLIPKYGGSDVTIEGTDHQLFSEDSVLGILKKK